MLGGYLFVISLSSCEEQAYNDFNGKWRGGFAIQNLGPKMKYDDGADDDGDFLPTMSIRGFDFIFII